jgi:hypothetical protein
MTPPVDHHVGSAKPLLLVDVDSVLAVIDGGGDPRNEVVGVTFEARFEARGFPILVPTATREPDLARARRPAPTSGATPKHPVVRDR